MPVTKRQKAKMIARRFSVAELYLTGWTQTQIAQHLDVTQATVSHDLKACRKRWKKETDTATEARMQEHLIMLKKARAAFEAAQDWRGYLKTLESERRLLGLDAPTRKQLTGSDGSQTPMILFDFGDER